MLSRYTAGPARRKALLKGAERMANARKMTPARFLKRNRPYFILALVLIVLAASIFLILRRISSFSPKKVRWKSRNY